MFTIIFARKLLLTLANVRLNVNALAVSCTHFISHEEGECVKTNYFTNHTIITFDAVFVFLNRPTMKSL